jgi:hypothetical protein
MGDPFAPPPPLGEPDPLPVAVLIHSEALRMLAGMDAAASEEKSRPVLVLRDPRIPPYYGVAASSEALFFAGNDDVSILSVYVPFDLMRIGLTRAPLGSVAERLAESTFNRTLAAYVRSVLLEPDTSLPEYATVADMDFAAIAAGLESDPERVAEYFGESVDERENEDVELTMRVSLERQSRLEAEPAESEDSAEEASGDETDEALAAVFMAPAIQEGELPAEESDPEGLARELLADYVIAHTRAHLSPVVARGLLVYKARGTTPMTQELKVTKAPRKTLAALTRFACHRYRKVALVYDRFDQWEYTPEDMKAKIVGAFAQIRMAMGPWGEIVLMAAAGAAPELEDQLSAGWSVPWTMSAAEQLVDDPPRVDEGTLRELLLAAVLPGREDSVIASARRLAELVEPSAGDAGRLLAMASATVQDAARRGLAGIDDAALAAGRQAIAE